MKMLRRPAVLIFLSFALYMGTTVFVIRKHWPELTGQTPVETAFAKAHGEKSKAIVLGLRPWDFWSDGADEMIAALKTERAQLDARQKDLQELEKRIAAERAELDRTREQIVQSRQQLDKAATEMTEDEAKNLRALAQTYAKLTPRGAVTIFRELDDTTVLKILSLMKADTVSLIFEEMSRTADQNGTLASRAAALTEKLRLIKAAKKAAADSTASS